MKDKIIIRPRESIFRIHGEIENGTFNGRWHFSFGDYYDPDNTQFGTLRVFNDDTLSPGAVWPLHPHKEIEVVTYCADGEFRHADERGKGGVLKKGWVQHTTVGKGMWHSEINNRKDLPMRFIQMWFLPSARGLSPQVEQKAVDKAERTNRFLALVSNRHENALKISSDAMVLSIFLEKEKSIGYTIDSGRGGYLYVLEGGPVRLNDNPMEALSAAKITGRSEIRIHAEKEAELLLVDVSFMKAA